MYVRSERWQFAWHGVVRGSAVSAGVAVTCVERQRRVARRHVRLHFVAMARPKHSPRHAAQYDDLPPRGPGIHIHSSLKISPILLFYDVQMFCDSVFRRTIVNIWCRVLPDPWGREDVERKLGKYTECNALLFAIRSASFLLYFYQIVEVILSPEWIVCGYYVLD